MKSGELIQLIRKFIADLAAVLARVSVVVRRHPLAQQELGLLQEAGRVLELAGLEKDEYCDIYF